MLGTELCDTELWVGIGTFGIESGDPSGQEIDWSPTFSSTVENEFAIKLEPECDNALAGSGAVSLDFHKIIDDSLFSPSQAGLFGSFTGTYTRNTYALTADLVGATCSDETTEQRPSCIPSGTTQTLRISARVVNDEIQGSLSFDSDPRLPENAGRELEQVPLPDVDVPNAGVVDEPLPVPDVEGPVPADLGPQRAGTSVDEPDPRQRTATAVTFSCASFRLTGPAGYLTGSYSPTAKVFNWAYIPNARVKSWRGKGEWFPDVSVNYHPVNAAGYKFAAWSYEHHDSFGNPLSFRGVFDRSTRTLKTGDKITVGFTKTGYANNGYQVIFGRITCRVP